MTYRDDRDATLARADALQEDLKRAEAERDRLKAEVERLESERTATPPPAPVQAIVTTRTQALTSGEVGVMLCEVESGLRPARSEVDASQAVAAAILIGSVPMYFFLSLLHALIVTGIGLIITVAAVIDAWTNDDAAIFAAVRDHPDDVLELVETRHGIRIVTRTKSATCTAPDRAELLVKLAKYCSNACVSNG
jgi:hypothetical protein